MKYEFMEGKLTIDERLIIGEMKKEFAQYRRKSYF